MGLPLLAVDTEGSLRVASNFAPTPPRIPRSKGLTRIIPGVFLLDDRVEQPPSAVHVFVVVPLCQLLFDSCSFRSPAMSCDHGALGDMGEAHYPPRSSQDLKDLHNSPQTSLVWYSRPRLWGCIWNSLGRASRPICRS